MLDVRRMVDIIRRERPEGPFSLEMITRDPLEVPCLTGKYWSTFADVSGVCLARTLSLIRANRPARRCRASAG